MKKKSTTTKIVTYRKVGENLWFAQIEGKPGTKVQARTQVEAVGRRVIAKPRHLRLQIAELIEELEDEGVVDRAPDFFESVKEKITGIQETVDNSQHVTKAQQDALNNMESGVRRWIH